MSEKNNSIQKFDSGILKGNLNKLIDDNGLTQTEFGEIAGISGQSSVSNKLSFEKKDCVKVEELVNIALYFHVSTDYLLGIAPTKKEDEDVTLTDIFQRLFEIDDMVGIEIFLELVPISDNLNIPKTLEDPMLRDLYTERCLISLNDKILQQRLRAWYYLQNIEEADDDTKSELLSGWKERLIEKGVSCRKVNDFQPDDDQPPQKP